MAERDDHDPIHGKDAMRAYAKLSGAETDLAFAIVYTIRDGKIARGRQYWNREEALEAAGLRE